MNNASSQAREPPPDLLTDPDVNLSAHPAPTVQPVASNPFASGRINTALFVLLVQANILPDVYDPEAFYISALPISLRCDSDDEIHSIVLTYSIYYNNYTIPEAQD